MIELRRHIQIDQLTVAVAAVAVEVTMGAIMIFFATDITPTAPVAIAPIALIIALVSIHI
jgi:hypothetical protein